MVAISHLFGPRSSACGCLRIGPSTVATDDLHASMRAEPAHNGVGFPIRQDLDRTMGLQIDQQCPVAVAFFPGKLDAFILPYIWSAFEHHTQCA